MTAEPPVLELRGISKAFGSVQALTDVDLEVKRGEVMALVGDNGAGKSTLIKCVAGIHAADEGEVFFEGEQVNISGPREAARLGIEVGGGNADLELVLQSLGEGFGDLHGVHLLPLSPGLLAAAVSNWSTRG